VERASTKSEVQSCATKVQTGGGLFHAKPRRARIRMARLQVIGFSPVIKIFDGFSWISQPEEFDFSPVTKICLEKFPGKGCSQSNRPEGIFNRELRQLSGQVDTNEHEWEGGACAHSIAERGFRNGGIEQKQTKERKAKNGRVWAQVLPDWQKGFAPPFRGCDYGLYSQGVCPQIICCVCQAN